jgi:hypothetical protein
VDQLSGAVQLFCPRPLRVALPCSLSRRRTILKESPESQFKGPIVFNSRSRTDDKSEVDRKTTHWPSGRPSTFATRFAPRKELETPSLPRTPFRLYRAPRTLLLIGTRVPAMRTPLRVAASLDFGCCPGALVLFIDTAHSIVRGHRL